MLALQSIISVSLLMKFSAAVWYKTSDLKLCRNDVIKTIDAYSLVQCIASCKRSPKCESISFNDDFGSSGKCFHLKPSDGECDDRVHVVHDKYKVLGKRTSTLKDYGIYY